ncbi:MAG: O-antigen polymerase [Solirubrobacterales bacterium]
MTNPLFIFAAVWSVVVTLYLAGVAGGLFLSPRPLTIGVLAINAVAFPLGYLTWTLFTGLVPQDAELPGACGRPATPERIQRALTVTLLAGVAAAVLMLYRVSVIAGQFNVGLADLFVRPQLLRLGLVMSFETAASRTSAIVQMIALTSGLFAIGFVLLGVFLYVDTTMRKYVFLCGFLIVGFAICLMNLSRYDMTVYVMYLILSYVMVGSAAGGCRFRRVAKDLLIPILTIVVIFTAVELLLHKRALYDRATDLSGILYSFYWYLASPTAALDEFLANFQGGLELGQNTFLPFWKWLSRVGLLPEHQVSVYGEYVFIPYPANVYTYLHPFYKDFGIIGVAVFPYLFGGLLAALREPAGRYVSCLYLYVTLLVPILFSFFSYPILSTQFYLQILFAFLFFRYDLRAVQPADPELERDGAVLMRT